jgi:dephospho-CoA kinase
VTTTASSAAWPSPPVIGLIGGIGSGKSMVAAELKRRGALVLSGDQLGHEGLLQPAICDQVVNRWGRGVLTEGGEIDRRKLGEVVFADQKELRVLESLLFPWIVRRFREEIERARSDPKVRVIVLDAAVLLEAGWNEMCSAVVYIDAPRALRLHRVAEQRGWDEKEVEARERAQWSLTDKVSRADFVIDNSGPPEALSQQVTALLQLWGIDN